MGFCGLVGRGTIGLGGGGKSGTFGSGIVGPGGSVMSGPGGVGFGDMVVSLVDKWNGPGDSRLAQIAPRRVTGPSALASHSKRQLPLRRLTAATRRFAESPELRQPAR